MPNAIRTTKLTLLLLGICSLLSVHRASASDAAVTIQVNNKNGTAAFGNGFVSSTAGTVVTCYHVVDGATSIKVWYKKGVYAAHPLRIAPDRDIAELQMENVPLPTTFLPILKTLPNTIQDSELTVEGYVAGVFDQRIPARATKGSFVRSGIVKGQHGEQIFKQRNVNLLLLDIIIYNGMSGAPVITKDGHVIGILSGSLNQGGSIAWAIAIENLDPEFAIQVDQPTAAFVWPTMTLMSDGWQSLRRKDGVGQELIDKIESFTAAANSQELRLSVFCNLLNGRLNASNKMTDLLAKRPDLDNISINVLNIGGLEQSLGSSLSQLMDDTGTSEPGGAIGLPLIFSSDKDLGKQYRDLVDSAQVFESNLPPTENNKAIKKRLDGQFGTNVWRQTLMTTMMKAENQKIDLTRHPPPVTVGELRKQVERSKLSDEGWRGALCQGKMIEASIASETALDFRQLLLADLVDSSDQ